MDAFTAYKGQVQGILRGMGWSNRGIFLAFLAFKVYEAFASNDHPEDFARRVDDDAPLGMASA